MKTLNRSQQNFLKSLHLIAVSLWLTGVVILGLMVFVSRNVITGDELYMYDYIYHFIDMKVITPAAIATLLTGLVYSIFTKWGFFKHGWLIYKWLVTLGIILVGTFYLGPMVSTMLEISDVKRIAALEDSYYQLGGTVGLWAAIINTVLLVTAVVFSVYKPWKNIKKSSQ